MAPAAGFAAKCEALSDAALSRGGASLRRRVRGSAVAGEVTGGAAKAMIWNHADLGRRSGRTVGRGEAPQRG